MKKRAGKKKARKDPAAKSPRRSWSSRKPPRKPRRPTKKKAASEKKDTKKRSQTKKSKGRAARRAAARRAVKRRRRPTARAAARRAKVKSNPMPKPPARRKVGRTPSRAASAQQSEASEELRAQLSEVQSTFERLESEAQLGSVYNAIGDFDSKLVELPGKLESLRARGYVHSGQLEDDLEALDDKWDEIRPRVETTLREEVERLDKELDEAERRVGRLSLSSTLSAIGTAEKTLDSLSRRIDAAENAVESLYSGMESEMYQVEGELWRVSEMLDHLDESQEIRLRDTEGPLLAVKTVWHQRDDEGPEGLLVLTDQRLLFEQREEVVTKKFLGIFKQESEEIEKLLLDIAVHDIESVTDKEEGGFLGMGKDDILELILSANAPVSRARFHLKGQDSADWARMIKLVQTGEIDEDRADEYEEELEEASSAAAAFPTECPNCFAAVPPPPRGVTSVTCEFCGTVVTASSSEAG